MQIANTGRTDHPEEVFGSVNRAHFLLRPHFDTRPGNKPFPNFRVLWSLEPVQEVGP